MTNSKERHRLSLIIATLGPSTDDEKELLEQLACHYSAKGPQNHHHKSGLFSRLFGKDLN